jgi:ssDNA-binding Zn-finger/Zn-ribbon topoisomerase 1
MEKDAGQDRLAPHEITERFDTTLAQHLERLVGTSVGIGALSLNLETISCLVLLAERESEIESVQFLPPKRYTNETFVSNLAEIGLESDEDFKTVLQDMIQKGYIRVDSIGRFLPEKPAISMVQLLDSVFPAMPGMNLVAYLVQTMGEVLSGRKDLESAINQFDQTLQMHGASPSRERPQPEMAQRSDKDQQPPTQKKRLKLSGIYRRRQAETRPQAAPVCPSEPKIVSASGEVSEFEVRELFPKGDESPEIAPDTGEGFEAQEPEVSEAATGPEPEEELTELPSSVDTEGSYEEQDISPEPGSEEPDLREETVSGDTTLEEAPSDQKMQLPVSEPVEQETDLSTDTEVEKPETKADQAEEADSTVETEYETDVVSEAHETITADDLVERRIAAFEEDLAMVCPVCTTGKIKAEPTAKGKLFYMCSSENCVFVSWGKPHHIVCPQCRNPFLIESTDRDGKTILRCPRATCHHRQKLPWETSDSPLQDMVSTSEAVTKSSVISRRPRRKVVRKRRVRRKRKR